MDFPTAVEKYWAHVTTAAAGLWIVAKAILDQREKRRLEEAAQRQARAAAKLDIDRLARELIDDAVEILRGEVKRLSEQVDDLRAEMREQQREHLQMMAGKDAELAVARGQIRQLEARCEAYRRQLMEHDITVPLVFEAQQARPDGNLKTMGAAE